jgi:hypothetical protein
LIVGIVHPCSRETVNGSANHSRQPVSSAASRELTSRKTKSRQPLVAERKRFDATEDRDHCRSAVAAQPVTEVMHPKSISRELAQENEDRPGIA